MKPPVFSPPRPICADHPEWLRLYDAAWRMAEANLKIPGHLGWKEQMTCIPALDRLWVWDSCFMTFFARYGNGVVPVMNNLDNLYAAQREDGFIAMGYDTDTGQPAFGERINPPLLAWAELHYWRGSGDASRLERVLPKLVALYRWIERHRRYASGLYWFEDAGSSGMDNAPRSSYPSPGLNGDGICHIDLASQQALSAEAIATLADAVGGHATRDRFQAEYHALRERINHYHWDERSGFYYDLFSRADPSLRHNFLNHKTAASFWPLVAGICSPVQAERLVARLCNPAEFWTLHPVATLSRDDPNFDPMGGYWLGGVWAPVNYMIAKGLERYGYHDLARQLSIAHLTAMETAFAANPETGIYEAYAPERLEAARHSDGRTVRDRFVGWSGLGPVAMLIENVIGLQCDGAARLIRWRHPLSGPLGICNLMLGSRIVSLESIGLHSRSETLELEVASDGPWTLEVLLPGETQPRTEALAAGSHRLRFPVNREENRRVAPTTPVLPQ